MSCHGSAFGDQNRHRPPVEGAQPHTQRHLNCGLNETGISHSSKNQNSCYLWLPHKLLCVSWECERQIWGPEVASMPPAPERAGQKEGWSGPSRKWSTLSERQASCRRSHDPWVPAVFSIQVCGLGSRVHCRLLAWGCFQHCELPLTHPAQREEARWACIKIPEHQHIWSLHPQGLFAPQPRHTPSLPSPWVTSVLVQRRKEASAGSKNYHGPQGSILIPCLLSFPTLLFVTCHKAMSQHLGLQILTPASPLELPQGSLLHGPPSYFMANRWGKNENSDRLYFLGLQNDCRW